MRLSTCESSLNVAVLKTIKQDYILNVSKSQDATEEHLRKWQPCSQKTKTRLSSSSSRALIRSASSTVPAEPADEPRRL